MTLHIRPDHNTDKAACLTVFEGNVPAFFAPPDRVEFAQFLDEAHTLGVYLVAAEGDAIVGCGGYFVVAEQGVAGLMWGMVERTRQWQGIGRRLLLARLAALCADGRAAHRARHEPAQPGLLYTAGLPHHARRRASMPQAWTGTTWNCG
jgi:GNAT superfamily N-acetyltransferase